MGPSGSGKSLVGAALAADLGIGFIDADELHPKANIAKMRAGTPLTDDDRWPWLDAVASVLVQRSPTVIACSALRRSYRDRIRERCSDAFFVELVVPEETLSTRMRDRDHFMPPSLLSSQLQVLEPLGSDESGVRVANDASLPDVIARIVELMKGQSLR